MNQAALDRKSEVLNSLREIGLLLDRDQYPRVYNGGVVRPGDAVIVSSSPGEGISHVKREMQRQAAPRQKTTPRKRSSRRSRPSGQAAQLVSTSLSDSYDHQIARVCEAYPGTQVWRQAEGMWLLVESTVIVGLDKKATFLIALPYSAAYIQQSWAFWTTPINWEWIGARHTNFPLGSICAFNPGDGTWTLGDSLIQLIDLYTLWALRHEHLKVFGRWPGRQHVIHPYERLTESSPNELCGCDKTGLRYGECCRPRDLSIPLLDRMRRYTVYAGGSIDRSPPPELTAFIKTRRNPPDITPYFMPIVPHN